MKSDHVWLLVLYFMLVTCLGAQTEYTIPLKGAEYALAVPTMAAGADGTLYVAYRTFSLLRRSANLQLIAYDLNSRRELRRTTVSVPEIRGSRVADGLYISRDGQLLAYAEAQDPSLILLLSTRDLSEIRRSTHLPFTLKDKQRSFAGFDGQDLLSFASDQNEGLRFIRIAPTDLKVISDAIVSGLHQERSQHILWSPTERRVWIYKPNLGTDAWQEYSEEGKATGQELRHRNGLPYGAVFLGEGKLLAFYGNMAAKGAIVSYSDHRTAELSLECLPHPYGTSNDSEYAGTICTTSPDRKPENGGNQILSSQFLLLKTREPLVIWRQKMDYLDIVEKGSDDGWFHQTGNPLVWRSGKQIWIVAPSKSPNLVVYTLPSPQ